MKILGQVVDIHNRRIFPGELHLSHGIIRKIKEIPNAPDVFIMPGFVDAHVHVESSMLVPSEFARLAVTHGSIASVSDPHEIGNVLGKEGVRFMIENGKESPFKFYFGAPSCVPATLFETAGAEINLEDLEEILSWDGVNYLAEMMNFPAVLNDDPSVMAKIELALKLGKVVDGHAPGLLGEEAAQYIRAGISTDHECFSIHEAIDKLKGGMKILIREGSAAKNFDALYTLIDDYPDQIMFCSDDKHPDDLVDGHINQLASRAIARKCDLFNVLRACSRTPILHYKMDVGLLREGDKADFCISKDLSTFEILETFIDGRRCAKEGKSLLKSVKIASPNNFDCSPLNPEVLKVRNQGRPFKVIVVEDGQLITKSEVTEVGLEEEYLESKMEDDVLKMVVVNRYFDAPPAFAFVKNFGLKRGAIASSVAHDSHNIIAVGTNDKDLSLAINQIIKAKGGVSYADDKSQGILPLPVAGIMSDKEAYEVAKSYSDLDRKAKELGSQLASPYMTLSFCALLVIPELKLSDKGLFDGNTFSYTSLFD